MRFVLYITIVGVLLVAACRSSDNGSPANQNLAAANTPTPGVVATPVHSKIDACALLNSDDLKAVQGEAYKDAQRSDRLDGTFIVAQCYYAMPTTANSVVLNVTTAKDEAGGQTPKAFWEQIFGGNEEKERAGKGDRDRERDKQKDKAKPGERGAEGEEKEAARPERVKGLGDEAFWAASPVGGAIYVLKKDLFFRISVGGAGDQKTKLNKSKLLAQKVLTKL
ncbi:MAG TPA: hypothetical protein VK557_12165 [Pyrinomonadaceae bacterium]|nr:hypothetical protein [Pyrinomonadaceae bacterium]